MSTQIARKATISRAVKETVALRFGCRPGHAVQSRCWYCDQVAWIVWPIGEKPFLDGATFDHIRHEYRGGETTAENLMLACRSCNSARGPLSVVAFWRKRRGLT